MVALTGVTVMEDNTITLRIAKPEMFPYVAVIARLPFETTVANPAALMVATDGEDEIQ